MLGQLNDRDRWLVPLSLWGSFLANDGEELVTMADSTRRLAARVPQGSRAPRFAREMDRTHVAVGVTWMGLLYGAAVIDGIRTRGRGWLYQDVQWVFGLHGLGHIAASLATRSYTSGVATSPTVVLPQLAYAVSRLRAAGVPSAARPVRAFVLVAAWLVAAHTLGARVSRRRAELHVRRGGPA